MQKMASGASIWTHHHHISQHSTHTRDAIAFFTYDLASKCPRMYSKWTWITSPSPIITISTYGKDTEEHTRHLIQPMKTASQKGLVLNSSKYIIWQSQITFSRAIFTAQGMSPNPSKLQDLQDLPIPDNQAKHQLFFRTHKLLTTLSP